MKQRLRDLEARDNWIAARVDELLDDEDWTETQFEFYKEDDDTGMSWSQFSMASAKRQAEKEHASIIADLEEVIIDSMELK